MFMFRRRSSSVRETGQNEETNINWLEKKEASEGRSSTVDVTTDRLSGFGTERLSGHGTERLSGFGTERMSGYGTERMSGYGTERMSGYGTERMSGYGTERLSGYGTERLSGFGTERLSGYGTERLSVESPRTVIPTPRETPVSPVGSRGRSVAGTVSAHYLMDSWQAPDGTQSTGSTTSGVEGDDEKQEEEPAIALEPYAMESFNTEVKAMIGGNKHFTVEEQLSWTGKHISAPLTMGCNKDKASALKGIAAFGTIMGYMGDKKVKETPAQLMKSLQKQMLGGSQEFQDEVFCQLCKQTTKNPDTSVDLHGWQLIIVMLAVVMPSPGLMPYFKKHVKNGPIGTIPGAYARCALSALEKEDTVKPRRFASSDVELMALVQLAAVPVMIHFQDDTQLEVAVDSWTSVRDLERQIADRLEIQNAIAFSVFELSDGQGERALGQKDRVLDVVASWDNESFRLLYKLRLRLRANESDPAAVKITYLQTIEDFKRGQYVVSIEDCTELAACQMQVKFGDYDKRITNLARVENDLQDLVPLQIAKSPEADDLAAKIMAFYIMHLKGVSRQDARAMFMRAMYKVPTFGYDYFNGYAFDRPIDIAIGAKGIRLIDGSDPGRRVLADCSFEDVESFTAPTEDVALITLLEQGGTSFVRAVPIQSPNAVQMKSLVHAYFVRYVLPNREKAEEAEQGETKTESGDGDDTEEDETQHDSEDESDEEVKYERVKRTTSKASKASNGKGDRKKPDGIMKKNAGRRDSLRTIIDDRR